MKHVLWQLFTACVYRVCSQVLQALDRHTHNLLHTTYSPIGEFHQLNRLLPYRTHPLPFLPPTLILQAL